jgi:hypothetical protein
MVSIFDRIQAVQNMWTRASNSALAQNMTKALTRDLPSWLLELSALTPVEIKDLSAGLNAALSNLIRTCDEERKLLGSRHGRNALAVQMSLARLSGVMLPLQASLGSYSAALRRSDPRLAAISASYGPFGGPAPITVPLGRVAPALALDASARKTAEELRAVLRQAIGCAQRIQGSLRGARGADPSAVAGAIGQTEVLLGWLRQAQERCSGPVREAAGAVRA